MTGPIVVAVDGSPAAQRAARVAVELARALGVETVFVHGSPKVARALFAENPDTRDTSERVADADTVLGAAAEVARASGVPHRLEVVGEESRDVAADIVGMAEAEQASLIVIGSRGLGGVRSALLGSVSRQVIDATDIPVVVVHAERA